MATSALKQAVACSTRYVRRSRCFHSLHCCKTPQSFQNPLSTDTHEAPVDISLFSQVRRDDYDSWKWQMHRWKWRLVLLRNSPRKLIVPTSVFPPHIPLPLCTCTAPLQPSHTAPPAVQMPPESHMERFGSYPSSSLNAGCSQYTFSPHTSVQSLTCQCKNKYHLKVDMTH